MRDGVESSEQFLLALAEKLKERPSEDIGLTAILEEHILTDAQIPNAVTNAKAAIVALAEERARQLMLGAVNE